MVWAFAVRRRTAGAHRACVAHYGRARQRVWHGYLVQLGEDLYGLGGLPRVHGATFREMDGQRRQGALPVREEVGFPPLILAINIAEAVIRDFQVFSFGLWQGGIVENLWTISGPWNIMNGIAGILNIITICGWFGIIISKDPAKDMIWPDMIWAWIIAYDLWNFAYTYNCWRPFPLLTTPRRSLL